MAGDAALVEAGGKGDYLFGDSQPFPAAKVEPRAAGRRHRDPRRHHTDSGADARPHEGLHDVDDRDRRRRTDVEGRVCRKHRRESRHGAAVDADVSDHRRRLRSRLPRAGRALRRTSGWPRTPACSASPTSARSRRAAAPNPFVDPAGWKRSVEERRKAHESGGQAPLSASNPLTGPGPRTDYGRPGTEAPALHRAPESAAQGRGQRGVRRAVADRLRRARTATACPSCRSASTKCGTGRCSTLATSRTSRSTSGGSRSAGWSTTR